jgi:hypothetical protein
MKSVLFAASLIVLAARADASPIGSVTCPQVFREPSAWVIVLIGLGIIALASVRLRT